MGKVTGFLEHEPLAPRYEPPQSRVRHSREFAKPPSLEELRRQAARCMDCGTPYCHTGCPIHNQIPDWNDLVYEDDWRRALAALHSTNNFPEWTGRVCPAPCEAACTLNLIDKPVTIKAIELAIVERGWQEGWIVPQPAARASGRSIGIVGSGPAGLAAAQQLARAGHKVTIYERAAKPGGLLRYGIPDFKLEKRWVERRIAQMEAEGVRFRLHHDIGRTHKAEPLLRRHDALVLAIGAEAPRDLPIEGRDFQGVHFAMDFLRQQNQRIGQEKLEFPIPLNAEGKHVVVIGGGDTGSDCIGTSFRQGAKSVTQLEILPPPPRKENKALSWPHWPLKMRTSTSQEEGAARDFAVRTVRFLGEKGAVRALECVRLNKDGEPVRKSAFTVPAELVLLAMGFQHPLHDGALAALKPKRSSRGLIAADERSYRTSRANLFACGDARRGQSLIVWAIREGRQCAHAVDAFVRGRPSALPRV